MQRYIIGFPQVEPLLLPAVKRWLRVDHSDDDELIAGLIKAARERVEARTGRLLPAQSWRIVVDQWPANGQVLLPVMPVVSVIAVRVANEAGVFSTLAPTNYQLEAKSDPSVVFFSAKPNPGVRRSGIEIDVVAGYGSQPGDCPESLKQAMLLLIGEAYERRGPDQTVAGRVPAHPDVDALLAPYLSLRLGRLAFDASATGYHP